MLYIHIYIYGSASSAPAPRDVRAARPGSGAPQLTRMAPDARKRLLGLNAQLCTWKASSIKLWATLDTLWATVWNSGLLF